MFLQGAPCLQMDNLLTSVHIKYSSLTIDQKLTLELLSFHHAHVVKQGNKSVKED